MTSSELAQTELLKEQQASAELEMFYLLPMEQCVLLLSQCQSGGTQKSRPNIERRVSAVQRNTGKRAG